LQEIIEGDLHVTPPPSIEHQRISRNLEFTLHHSLRRYGVGDFLCPVGVRLSNEDVLEPDLVVVLAEHAARVGTQVSREHLISLSKFSSQGQPAVI
jgi:Uma2 family endonuclease